MTRSEFIKQLTTALAQAQAEMPVAVFDATNPFLNSKYASLGAVIQASRPILAKHKLSLVQFPISDATSIGVESILTHASGEFVAERVLIPLTEEKGKSKVQAAGSTLTYLRRYSWASILECIRTRIRTVVPPSRLSHSNRRRHFRRRHKTNHKNSTDMQMPQDGKYVCKLNDQLVIYEASTGSLCAAVPCVMPDGFQFKHTLVLVKSDGTIQTKTADTLKAVFGWDGVDPFWLMDNSVDDGPMREVEFEIVGGPETGDKGGQYFKSQWLNPVGGGVKTPLAADRRSVLEKHGSKFRALAVGSAAAATPAKLTASAPTQLPAGRKSPPSPPPSAPTATMEEAWVALNEAQSGKPADAIERIWFETIAKLFPNKSNTDLKPREWGKLKAEFADQIPV